MNRAIARLSYFVAQSWRGEPVARVLRELESSQWSPPERLHQLQWKRQIALVDHAFATVPFYRERWTALGWMPGDLRSSTDWNQLPILEKEDLQNRAPALRSQRAPSGHVATTSGSSGTPVAVLRSHLSWAHAHANVFRGWRWHGLDVGDPYAYFWGLSLEDSGRRAAGLRDWFFNRVRLSAFELDVGRGAGFYRRLLRERTRFGFGYPSAVSQFADILEQSGLDGRALGWKAVITTAEVLHPHRRERLHSTFGCPVVDSYGCAETGVAGFQCAAGGMHVPIESTVVDLVPGPDGTTEILLTDLFNYSQPIIRYRIGDLAEAVDGACACGRGLPLLGRIHGRTSDALQLPDGRVVNGLLPYYIFRPYAKSGTVREYQFVQGRDGGIELRVVPGPGWSAALESEIETEVSVGLGVPVRLNAVPRFPRVGRGKHRDFVRAEEIGE